MERGIYTLANDTVYDQLVALLNSIEANYSKDVPVCVIPYADNISRVAGELKSRLNVTLFQDSASIAKWEKFAQNAWNLSPLTSHLSPKTWGRHELGVHRKLCCFDGPFKKFVFMDVDALLMQSLDFVFEKLDKYDFVVYDYQFKDPSHVYNMKSKKLKKVFPKERINREIFCTGFFASRKGLFDEDKINGLLASLKNSESEILYPNAPEQSLLNYMLMKTNAFIYNFALNLPYEKRTGNSITSTHFEEKEHILYDRGNKLTYLHYIGIGADVFKRLCAGERVSVPYKDIFLYYKYMHRV